MWAASLCLKWSYEKTGNSICNYFMCALIAFLVFVSYAVPYHKHFIVTVQKTVCHDISYYRKPSTVTLLSILRMGYTVASVVIVEI